ncbi:MAG TPA: 30S ribosomal protein S4 [Anaerolineaceae bacterium]|nr:30S ribosomal protein S4 [Anaerolineaceae bacterium]
MARNTDAVCRMCRREGEKLFLKGSRCFTPKCAFEKRGFPPGMHGKTTSARPDRVSDYGKQLRAKQKARREYGVFERQFRRYYSEALRLRGLTGMNLLQKLETRLDNVVYRLGFASSRAQARQLVNHGHFTVNGNRADIPSYDVHADDVITVSETSKDTVYFKNLKEEAEARTVPTWLARDVANFSGRVLRQPERSEIDGNLNEQLIVEYYSR